MKHLLLFILITQSFLTIAEERPVFKKTPDFSKKIINTIYGADELSSKKFSSTYVDSFDPGISFHVPILKKSQATDCAQIKDGGLSSAFIRNVSNIEAPAFKMQCDYVKELYEKKEFTAERCSGVANCLRDKLDYNSDEARFLFSKVREDVAKETVAMTARKSLGDMIEFEELRLFSASKYGEGFFPQSCQGFNVLALNSPRKKQCKSTIEKGFELAQKVCKIPETDCQRDYLDFAAKNPSKEDELLVSKYITEKTEKTISDVAKKDTGILQKIAYILADDSKKPEARVEEVFDFLGNNYQDLDPVFKDYYNRSFKDKSTGKKDVIRESLLSYVRGNKKSSTGIVVDLENLRKSEAKKMLEDQCGQITRMDDLCNVVHDVIAGIEVFVDKSDFDKVVSRQEGAFSSTISKEEIAKNVARCNTFVLTSIKSSYTFAEQRLSGGYDLFTPGEAKLKKETTFESVANGQSKIVIGIDGVKRTNQGLTFFHEQFKKEVPSKEKSNDLVLVRNFAKNDKLPEVYNKDTDGSKSSLVSGVVKKEVPDKVIPIRETVETSSQLADNFSSAPRTGVPGPKAIMPNAGSFESSLPIENRVEGSMIKPADRSVSDYQQLLGKVSELEQRLARRSGSVSSELPKAPGASAGAEDESSLIKELKAAKNELAEMNRVKSSRVAVVEEGTAVRNPASIEEEDSDEENDDEDTDESSSGSSGGARSTTSARSVASTSTAPASSSGGASSERQVSSNGQSQEGSSGPSSGDDISSTSPERSSDTIVLKVEGSATSDKLHELIYAESGKRFFIEEDGMVKEIIPALVDGKIVLNSEGAPVYKIVLKGKARDFKGERKTASRKLAKIESPADLKRADNDTLSTPAARYWDLQSLIHKKASALGN